MHLQHNTLTNKKQQNVEIREKKVLKPRVAHGVSKAPLQDKNTVVEKIEKIEKVEKIEKIEKAPVRSRSTGIAAAKIEKPTFQVHVRPIKRPARNVDYRSENKENHSTRLLEGVDEAEAYEAETERRRSKKLKIQEWDDLDIDDWNDPLMVSEYVVEIFDYMKKLEVGTNI